MKSKGKPEIAREISEILIQVRKESAKTNLSAHVSFSLAFFMLFCKLVVLFVVSRCELITLHSAPAGSSKYMCITYL